MIAMPPAARRQNARRDDGPAQRLTFRRDTTPQLAAVTEGSVIGLPSGEVFRVLEVTTDPTRRPVLVVRPRSHPDKENQL